MCTHEKLTGGEDFEETYYKTHEDEDVLERKVGDVSLLVGEELSSKDSALKVVSRPLAQRKHGHRT